MKIRTDFVSNSSSSSFVCMGYDFRNFEDELVKQIHTTDPDVELSEDWDYADEFFDGLDTCIDDDYGRFYVGLRLRAMKKDETLSQFQDRVRNAVIEKIPALKDELGQPGWIIESWYNG